MIKRITDDKRNKVDKFCSKWITDGKNKADKVSFKWITDGKKNKFHEVCLKRMIDDMQPYY